MVEENKNLVNLNKELTMSSRQIAELTGKRHSDVIRAIKSMEPAWLRVNGRKFALVEYSDAKGEKRPEYLLTKTESLYVATKFRDEMRAKLVLRWEELEKKKQSGLVEKEVMKYLLESKEDVDKIKSTVYHLTAMVSSFKRIDEALQEYGNLKDPELISIPDFAKGLKLKLPSAVMYKIAERAVALSLNHGRPTGLEERPWSGTVRTYTGEVLSMAFEDILRKPKY